MPLTIKVSGVDSEKKRIEAELSERQVRRYAGWVKSLLDRLIVLGVPQFEVRSALGLFECAVVCKLGTEATGLIPRIGRRLRNAVFSVFSPRRIRTFFGDSSFF